MPTEPEPSESNPESPYTMCAAYHQQINRLAYEDNLTVYEGEFSWRRHLTHDLYHSLRSQGDRHDDAVSGVLKALPHIYLDENGEAFFE